ELGDAAADVLRVLTVLDHRRGHEALGRGALADRGVDGERGAGRDDVAPKDVGDAVNVAHPRLAALVVRGERRHLLADAEGPRGCVRPVGWAGPQRELDGG